MAVQPPVRTGYATKCDISAALAGNLQRLMTERLDEGVTPSQHAAVS